MKTDFDRVLEMVTEGLTVQRACTRLKIPKSSFYRSLTEIQKQQIRHAKALNQSTRSFSSGAK